jgi:ribosomal protein S18
MKKVLRNEYATTNVPISIKHKCVYCEALCNELNFQDEIILDKFVTKEIK